MERIKYLDIWGRGGYRKNYWGSTSDSYQYFKRMSHCMKIMFIISDLKYIASTNQRTKYG